jgi:hypothetical protein
MPLNFFHKKEPNRLARLPVNTEPEPETCPLCAEKNCISFIWQDTLTNKDGHLAALAKHLVYLRPVKFGKLYQCPKNRLYWYLEDSTQRITQVPAVCENVFLSWCEHWLKLSFEQIAALREIGGIERDHYGNGAGEIKVPCKITRADGVVFDPAIVLVTNLPPMHEQRPNQILGRPDDLIEPSDYALPLDVRMATARAEEIRMGFMPTRISTKNGQNYILLGTQHVFHHLAIKGRDLTLNNEAVIEDDAIHYDNASLANLPYVYFDEYVGCQTMIKGKNDLSKE